MLLMWKHCVFHQEQIDASEDGYMKHLFTTITVAATLMSIATVNQASAQSEPRDINLE